MISDLKADESRVEVGKTDPKDISFRAWLRALENARRCALDAMAREFPVGSHVRFMDRSGRYVWADVLQHAEGFGLRVKRCDNGDEFWINVRKLL